MRTIVALVLVACWLGALAPAAAGEVSEELAVEAARTWLALVDAGEYAESYETAAAFFKGAVAKETWERILTTNRKPLGKVASRELKAKQHVTSLPNAPDGDYVVIQFETSFENKEAAVETITTMLDDGEWKAAGYFIK